MLRSILSDPLFWDRCRTTEADARSLSELIDAYCRISVHCHEMGLLAINYEEAVDRLPEPLGRAALRMIDEGWPPEFIEETCCSALVTSTVRGADVVRMALGIKAALMIQRGEETKLMRVALTALAGGALALEGQSKEWRLLRG